MAIRVGINGFGRIGRAIFRAWLDSKASNIQIVHINNLASAATSTHLMNYDSIHGPLKNPVQLGEERDNEQIITPDGQAVTLSHHKDPSQIPWQTHQVDLVFECTGVFTDRPGATKHLRNPQMGVVVSAPCKDPDLTVVYGVNHHLIQGNEQIISNASCTTNCLAPVCYVLNKHFTITHATMTTVHAVTNDQKTLDAPHKDLRRARSSFLSMIPTTTGAAKMVTEVLPELKGKLDGMAIRVPTTNVSLTDLVVECRDHLTPEHINKALTDAAYGELSGILDISSAPLVSTDFCGSRASSVVDLQLTKVVDATLGKLLLWYDNETAFSWRMLDVARVWGDKKNSY